jgi:hypothetical protein
MSGPPIDSNGSALSVSITTFGRNLRRSQRSTSRPDSRATECTVPRLITEIEASSKMPCLRFINSTSLPYRLESSSCSSSLRSSYSSRPAYREQTNRNPDHAKVESLPYHQTAFPTIKRKMRDGAAPRAIRTPISAVRCRTEVARTPYKPTPAIATSEALS